METWYYIQNGALNWNYTGLCQYYGTWYYIQNGTLNWKYTGLCFFQNKWYIDTKRCVGLEICKSCKSIREAGSYVKNGMIDGHIQVYFYIMDGCIISRRMANRG